MTRFGHSLPIHRTLAFRLGVVIFLALLAVDVATIPLWNWLYGKLLPEWSDPEWLRGYASALEALHAGEIRASDLEGTPHDLADLVVLYGAIVAYTAVFAVILAILISRLATRRIYGLTDQIRSTDPESDLPGPFAVKGSDEIYLLASTLNRMQNRIADLLEELRSRDRLRREWVSGVSHDLRAPLTALKASMNRSHSLVARLPESADRRTLEQVLAAAQLDADRVLDLSEDLLEMARLEADPKLVIEPVPAGELVRSAVESLRPLADEGGIAVDLSFPEGLPELQADGRLLIRALENVIVNSMRYARSRVGVSAQAKEGELQIAVEDDGPGLPSAEGEVVLEVLGPDRARADSTGIGLELARKIVDAHGGRLLGRNRPQGGASLRLCLPYEARPMTAG